MNSLYHKNSRDFTLYSSIENMEKGLTLTKD
jgi:hypothetical protein